MILTKHSHSNNINPSKQKIKAKKSKAKGQKKHITIVQQIINSKNNLSNPQNNNNLQAKKQPIKYIYSSSSKEPACPWTKQCFQRVKHFKTKHSLRSNSNSSSKLNPNLNSTSSLLQKSIQLGSIKKRASQKVFSVPKYKYKSQQDKSFLSNISTESKKSFLNLSKIKKAKNHGMMNKQLTGSQKKLDVNQGKAVYS